MVLRLVLPCTLFGATAKVQPQKQTPRMPRKIASDGRQQLRIGTRTDNRVFKFNRSWSGTDVDRVKELLQDVFDVCRGWNEFSSELAEHLRKGASPVPIPSTRLAEKMPFKIEGGYIGLWKWLNTTLPSINWASLSDSGVNPGILSGIRHIQMVELNKAAQAIGIVDGRQISNVTAVVGTVQNALSDYDSKIKTDYPENYDRQGKIKQLIDRTTDTPLALLDLSQCQEIYDYWRKCPPRHDGKGNYSEGRSRKQIAELTNVFQWLHMSSKYGWRKPEDFDLLQTGVIRKKNSTISILEMTHRLFSVDDLKKLMSTGTTLQRLIATWCNNCSHGAAEIGRVTWADIFLDQDHPWRNQGLQIDKGGNWIGFIRQKRKTVGWWSLWPETVALLNQWKCEQEQILGREVRKSDVLIMTEAGTPLYKNSKNGQAKFQEKFKDHIEQVGVRKMPLGTLRKQLANWIASTQNDAVVSSVALAHGIPHKGDVILFAHYANKPWAKLFQFQEEYRRCFFD